MDQGSDDFDEKFTDLMAFLRGLSIDYECTISLLTSAMAMSADIEGYKDIEGLDDEVNRQILIFSDIEPERPPQWMLDKFGAGNIH